MLNQSLNSLMIEKRFRGVIVIEGGKQRADGRSLFL